MVIMVTAGNLLISKVKGTTGEETVEDVVAGKAIEIKVLRGPIHSHDQNRHLPEVPHNRHLRIEETGMTLTILRGV